MRITLYCASCFERSELGSSDPPAQVVCRGCGKAIAVSVSAAMREQNKVDRCAMCSGTAFYIEKNFNRLLGWAILLATIGVYLYTEEVWVLLGVAALDAAAYYLIPSRTVCYRCQAEYRGCAVNPEHRRYEHKTAARYAEYRNRPSSGEGS